MISKICSVSINLNQEDIELENKCKIIDSVCKDENIKDDMINIMQESLMES